MTKINLKMDYLTLSHSLRIPLTEILGISELLEKENLSPTQRDKIEIIQQAGNRLLFMINYILANGVDEKGNHHFFNN